MTPLGLRRTCGEPRGRAALKVVAVIGVSGAVNNLRLFAPLGIASVTS